MSLHHSVNWSWRQPCSSSCRSVASFCSLRNPDRSPSRASVVFRVSSTCHRSHHGHVSSVSSVVSSLSSVVITGGDICIITVRSGVIVRCAITDRGGVTVKCGVISVRYDNIVRYVITMLLLTGRCVISAGVIAVKYVYSLSDMS